MKSIHVLLLYQLLFFYYDYMFLTTLHFIHFILWTAFLLFLCLVDHSIKARLSAYQKTDKNHSFYFSKLYY